MHADLWKEQRRIVITCARGIAPWLAKEVHGLGFPVESEWEAAVETTGTLYDTLGLNLRLRTGHRVLWRLAAFEARDPAALFAGFRAIPWEGILHPSGPHAYLSVTSTADTPAIRDGRFVNVKAKDAIVDRITERCGVRPDSGPERDRAVVHVYWKGARVAVFLDTSGEPLSRRGYRKIPLAAPMQETLAAAVILATGWNGRSGFINPMCGSGTLAIEAALVAQGKAPGLLRGNFGFMHLKGFSADAWRTVRTEARLAVRETAARIVATDLDADCVAAARQNARTAGVENLISFSACPFEQTPVPEGKGVVVINPPYGERIGQAEQLAGLYTAIGDFFKKRCRGYTGFLFTGNPELAKKVGLRTRRRVPFYNGEIACRLLEYDLYEGTRKKGRQLGGA
jgi:putative N6-adenine-specific DNA methylase